jgi:hypothetical protein
VPLRPVLDPTPPRLVLRQRPWGSFNQLQIFTFSNCSRNIASIALPMKMTLIFIFIGLF